MSLDHPFYQVAAAAEKLVADGDGKVQVYQKWTCQHCGSRQTMETPNAFYKAGICEECKKTTDIEKRGCNYLISARGDAPNVADILLGGLKKS